MYAIPNISAYKPTHSLYSKSFLWTVAKSVNLNHSFRTIPSNMSTSIPITGNMPLAKDWYAIEDILAFTLLAGSPTMKSLAPPINITALGFSIKTSSLKRESIPPLVSPLTPLFIYEFPDCSDATLVQTYLRLTPYPYVKLSPKHTIFMNPPIVAFLFIIYYAE